MFAKFLILFILLIASIVLAVKVEKLRTPKGR
jgi:hypothetical protein